MASPDMDVIKEIPGYKVILKAILKSQIQQLVEQLAAHTEEESIILTASVSDGTLSHLGSDSGKSFLEDHEDVKSQFLGFCLKFHHKKKQEKERKEQEEKQLQMMARQQQQQFSPRGPGFMSTRSPGMQFSPRFSSPRQQMMMRSPGARHEPYPVSRPIRRTSLNFGSRGRGGPPGPMRLPTGNKTDNQVIKIEPEDPEDSESNQESKDSNNQPDATAGSSQPSSPSHTTPSQIKAEASEKDDDAKSNSSSSTIPNEASEMRPSDSAPQEGLSFDSDLSAIASDPSSVKATASGEDNEGEVNVKLEAITETEMELEITGVEPGRSLAPAVPQESWPQNMPYPGGGAMGSPADMQGAEQGYRGFMPSNLLSQSKASWDISEGLHMEAETKRHPCNFCAKAFKQYWELERHLRTHTGEKPYKCSWCDHRSSQKCHLKSHELRHVTGKAVIKNLLDRAGTSTEYETGMPLP